MARVAGAFHALDRLEVARELSKRREGAPPLPVYVEVNVGAEATKSGLAPTALGAFLDEVRALPNLQPVGLMALPPPTDDVARTREGFARLRELARAHALPALSMGTTHDFEQAILEGATVVRVGTAIFGERS